MRKLLIIVAVMLAVLLAGCHSTPQEQYETSRMLLNAAEMTLNSLYISGEISDDAMAKIAVAKKAAYAALEEFRLVVEGGGKLDYATALRLFNKALEALNKAVSDNAVKPKEPEETSYDQGRHSERAT